MLSSQFLTCLVVLLAVLSHVESVETTATTSLGVVQGKVEADARVFLGVPYAEPPVGDRRFLAPAAKKPWNGTLDATQFGAPCYQPNTDVYDGQSEDCLFMNIYSPLNATNTTKAPVFVYIHGGSFQRGTGNDFNVTRFAKAGTVGVAINYRLGILGFLALEVVQEKQNGTGAMNGLYDQIEALRWVKNNIAAFGGDPDQVTIAGESAGGLSVCLLNSARPEVVGGLFKRAVVFSGACNGAWGSIVGPELGMASGKDLVQSAFGLQTLQQLQDASVSELVAKYGAYKGDKPWIGIDGYLYTEVPWKQITASNAESMIMGNTNMDGLVPFKVALLPNTVVKLGLAISYLLSNMKVTSLLDAAYSKLLNVTKISDDNAREAYALMTGDACLVCPANDYTESIETDFPSTSIYLYLYSKSNSSPQSAYGGKYAMHAAEVDYLLGVQTITQKAPFGPWNIDDTAFSQNFFNYINSFVQNGTPAAQGQAIWESWTKTDQKYLMLNSNITAASGGIRKEQCAIWKNQTFEKQFNFCWSGMVKFPAAVSPTASPPTAAPAPTDSPPTAPAPTAVPAPTVNPETAAAGVELPSLFAVVSLIVCLLF